MHLGIISGGIEQGVIDIDLQGHLALSMHETAFNVTLVNWSSGSSGNSSSSSRNFISDITNT